MILASGHTYTDPAEFETAYKAAEVELTPTAYEPFRTTVTRIELNNVWMVRVQEATSRVKWAMQSPGRTFLRFVTEPSSSFIINGSPLAHNEIIHLGQAQSYYEHTTGPTNWAGLSLCTEAAINAGIVINGFDVFASQEQWKKVPAAEDMTLLRRVHADVSAAIMGQPPMLQHSEVVRSIQQSLISVLFKCLGDQRVQQTTWTQRNHETVMRRLRRMLESNPDRALYVPEICAAIHVPERTLRACCHQQLGVSPKHYLLLRRMRLAQRVLRSAIPDATTVTEVATQFGFWHFSRFAGSYREIFGETPSSTLRRMPS